MLPSHLPTFLLSDTFFPPLCAQPWYLHTSQLHLRPINKPEAAISLLLLAVCVDQLNESTRTSRDRGTCLVAMRHQGLNPLGGYWIKDGVFIVAWCCVRVQTEQPGSLSVNEIFIKMILCVLAREKVDCYSRTTKDVTRKFFFHRNTTQVTNCATYPTIASTICVEKCRHCAADQIFNI